jgi:hypothetical protein
LFLKECLVFFIILVEAIEQEGSESGASRRSLPLVIAEISSISFNSGNHRILQSYYQLQGNHAHLWNTLLHHFDICIEILIIGWSSSPRVCSPKLSPVTNCRLRRPHMVPGGVLVRFS